MADMDKVNKILDALKAAAANKAAGADKAAEGDKTDDAKKAFGEAAGHAEKAHKACKALHEHLSGMAADGHEGAKALSEDGEKVHKAMKELHGAVNKAAGMDAPKDGGGEKDGEKSEKALGLLADALKTIGGLQARLDSVEKLAYQPKSAGAGAALLAEKGMVPGAVPSKRPAEMNESERETARKAAFARTKQMPVALDEFTRTDMHTLRAADKVLQLAGQSGEAAN